MEEPVPGKFRAFETNLIGPRIKISISVVFQTAEECKRRHLAVWLLTPAMAAAIKCFIVVGY
jgi:hypothetical protein